MSLCQSLVYIVTIWRCSIVTRSRWLVSSAKGEVCHLSFSSLAFVFSLFYSASGVFCMSRLDFVFFLLIGFGVVFVGLHWVLCCYRDILPWKWLSFFVFSLFLSSDILSSDFFDSIVFTTSIYHGEGKEFGWVWRGGGRAYIQIEEEAAKSDDTIALCFLKRLWTARPYNMYAMIETLKKPWCPSKGLACKELGSNLVSFQFKTKRVMDKVLAMEP